MSSRTITVHAPDDALIVMSINEADGSVVETVLWGQGCEPALAGIVEAALGDERAAATDPPDGGVDIGWMDVDDRITATITREGEGDVVVYDAAVISERLIAFVIAALESFVGERRPATNDTAAEGDVS